MRRIRRLAACAAHLAMACVVLLHAAHASTPDAEAALTRGIAVLASSIGSDYSPEGLAESVRQGEFSPVVIDWAWITAHWNRTDFPALSRFLELMAAENVPVAAMYRPRFLHNPTVPIQTDQSGKPATSHGYSICFSSPEARQWGISWGTRILQKLPQIEEIIVYNPLNQCECAACKEAAEGESYAHYDAVWGFLAEAKAAWREQRPGVKLGVVFVNDPEFWKRGSEVLDVAHPFLFVTDDTDLAEDAAAAGAIRDLLPEKTGSCLAKVTWGPNDRVSPARLAQFDRTAAGAGLPYFFWTFETLFASELYDPEAVAIALGMEQPVTAASGVTGGEQRPAVRTTGQPKPAPPAAGAGERADRKYTAEQIRSTSVETFLERMGSAEPGYQQFAALQALVKKVKESEAGEQREMVSMVIAAMKDKSRPMYQRWQCCYVLSGSGAEQGVPDLVDVLLHDESEIVRSVAAEALGEFADNAAAHDALLEAARQERSPRVRETLARHLGSEMSAAEQRPAPTSTPVSAPTAEERIPVSTSSSFEGITNPPGGFHRGSLMYSPEQIRITSAEVFLERMLYPQQDYNQFAALNALIQKVKESDPVARDQIMSLVIGAMHDESRLPYQRWQCCRVISASQYEQGVPDLIQVLLHDESETVRGVAEEALKQFPANAETREALSQAARQGGRSRPRETARRAPSQRASAATSIPAVTAPAVEERAPSGPPEPPPGPPPPVSEPLPWPFPGGQEDQHIFNNYQQATDIYIHSGLDFIQPAGTPVTAVDSGYVAAIYTNYPDWVTRYGFIVTPERGGNEGWCYTHLDTDTFTFGEGDFVRQGERLGSLVDFSVGDRPGVSHLHLHYVRFSRDASGKVNVHSLLDPLYFFDWEDTEPPVFQPLRFVTEGLAERFPADAAGVVTVSGRVDVLAAVTDSAYPGHMGNLGVPVVMLSISDGKYTMQKLVLDHRGDVGNERQVKPLYLSYDQKKAFLDPDSFPRY